MISPEMVAAFLAPETADPTIVAQLIEEATAILGRELNLFLGTPAETVEMHHGGRSTIFLYDTPSDPSTVVVETRDSPTGAWEELDPSEYALDGKILRHGSCWPRGMGSVRVTYERGYEVDQGPAELLAFVRRMVLANLEEVGAVEEGGFTEESIGDYSYKLASVSSWDITGMDGYLALASRWRPRRL